MTIQALLLCVIAALPAQTATRPKGVDFSGDWVLVSPEKPAADQATALTVKQPVTDKNVYGAPMPPAYLQMTVERHAGTGITSQTYRLGIKGGTFGSPSAPIQTRTQNSVTWEGDSLVMADSSWSGPADGVLKLDVSRTETWRLNAEGRLVITLVEQKDTQESRATLTYRRR